MDNATFGIIVNDSLRKVNTNIALDIDQLTIKIVELVCTREDYLNRPIFSEQLPALISLIGDNTDFCKKVITRLRGAVVTQNNLLRLHDLIDFSYYLVQVSFQTIGQFAILYEIVNAMNQLLVEVHLCLYEIKKDHDAETMASLIENIIFTLSSLFLHLSNELEMTIQNNPIDKLQRCALKVKNSPDSDYLVIIDDVFDMAVKAAENGEYCLTAY